MSEIEDRTLEDDELTGVSGGWKIPDPTKKKKVDCPSCHMHLTIPVNVTTCPFCHKSLNKR